MNNLRGKKEAAQNDTRSPIFFNYPAGARQDPGIRRNTSATSIRMSNNNDAADNSETATNAANATPTTTRANAGAGTVNDAANLMRKTGHVPNIRVVLPTPPVDGVKTPAQLNAYYRATAETNEHNEALIEEQEREARDRKKKEKRRRRERAKREKERMRRNQTKSEPPATAPVQQSSETAGRVLDHINLLSDEEEVMNQDINEGKKKNRKTKRKYY